MVMDKSLASLWAKSSKDVSSEWHPLILHMLDVAASVEAVLSYEPESTSTRIAACLGMEWEDSRPWLLLVTACHDLGKACPGFQCKRPKLIVQTCLRLPKVPNTEINHAFVSQIALAELLQEKDWPLELAELVADAVGCHHGSRAAPTALDNLAGDKRAIGGDGVPSTRGDEPRAAPRRNR
jgi:CRISPR-associated endonuclease/helicase Cas3